MSTITKERVAGIANGEKCYTHDDVVELARIALASLEAKSRKLFTCSGCGAEGLDEPLESKCHCNEDGAHWVEGVVYTPPPALVANIHPLLEFAREYIESWELGMAGDNSLLASARKAIADSEILQPAPASVPDEKVKGDDFELNGPLSCYQAGKIDGWNACRAAMLQGADGKPELTVWYGAMPETNGKTNWTAMLHRKCHHPWEGITIDCSEYPDRVRYEADRMRHLIGELEDEPDILAYDAEAHSGYVYPGNSPVIPDGWVMVPVDMTPEQMREAQLNSELGAYTAANLTGAYSLFREFWDVAIAAAPKQEVK